MRFDKIRLVTVTAFQFLDPAVFQAEKVHFVQDFRVFFLAHPSIQLWEWASPRLWAVLGHKRNGDPGGDFFGQKTQYTPTVLDLTGKDQMAYNHS